jgi:aminoglycoside 3-N-acetyltransferase
MDRSTRVTHSDIVDGLEQLGIRKGDIVFAHSSLSAFGHVEGGESVGVEALSESVEPSGAVVVPTFGDYFQNSDSAWDPSNSPSRMGRISECLRTRPDAIRSRHAIHPVSAIGARSADVVGQDHKTDFDEDSPFQRLIECGAWILLLGVGWNVCTMLHVAEERLEVPYRRWIERSGKVILDGVAQDRSYRFLARYPGVRNDFNPMGELLERKGLVSTAEIGDASCRAILASDLHTEAMAAVTGDPCVLVSEDTREEAQKYC